MDKVSDLVDDGIYVRPTIDVRMIEGAEEAPAPAPTPEPEP